MARACFPGAVASGLLEVRSDLGGPDRGGFWAVVVTFEGAVTCMRFADVVRFSDEEGRSPARARTGAGSENVMIADLVRNDLARVCRPGSVDVDALCAAEVHPGLVHLVTTVSGRLRPGVRWGEIAGATLPPGSVSGAPKSSALRAIADLETAPRGPYCGAVGWVDADAGEAGLAVGIRTFWADRDEDGARWLRFGTGAGITWGSDPGQEWAETELKAARLVGLASGRVRV